MNKSLNAAAELLGKPTLAKVCGATAAAAYSWINRGCLPRTEFTGETNYAQLIEAATEGQVTAADLRADSLHVYRTAHRPGPGPKIK